MPIRAARQSPFALDDQTRALFDRRLRAALASARADGRRAVATLTVPVPAQLDPSAVVCAARRRGDRYFCFEQPSRGGFALAGLGQAVELEGRGPHRFAEIAALARELSRRIVADDPAGDPLRPAAAGPVFVGGFAFAHDGGTNPEWASLPPASLVLPELALARHRGEARLTVCVAVEPDDDPSALAARAQARLDELAPSSLPLFDPDPVDRARVASTAPPSHYEAAVERAVEHIRAGTLNKIVLAREVRTLARRPHDPAAVLGALREVFPDCYCWCVGTPEAAFIGASPELLIRREGSRAQTVALAGTTRRSADPAVDDHLGERLLHDPKEREEHAIVTRAIEQALQPVSVWVATADKPVLVKVQNVQHLATPIRGQLANPLPTVELAGRLLPTPAVGGEPREQALPMIPALEGLDRGWYAGAVGWSDVAEDGEFCVALRCALLHGVTAHLYAGCGVVRDSVPSVELAETEVKFQALLPLLT
jgi:isochorismate synthase